MRIISKHVTETSDKVGEVKFDIIKATSEFFGSTNMIKMHYTKNNRKVTRSFDMDERGMIKFTNACKKLGIPSSHVLMQTIFNNMTIKLNGNFWVVFNGLVEVARFRKLEAAQQYIDALDYVTCLRKGRHEY